MNFLLSFRQQTRQQTPRRRSLFICAGLALLTVAVYWRVGTFPFLNYDDNDYITDNPWVHAGLRWDIVRWAFTTNYANNWHPLTWISHALDYQLFGPHAGAHHLVNLGFHVANTILLFLVLKRAAGGTWKCAVVAALFALHPLHVQSVAWVSERKDLLSTFFWLLTMGAYFLYVEKNRVAYFLAALFFMACGVMSKPMVMTLPAALLLLDFWPLHRAWSGRLLLEKIPFCLLSVVSAVTTFIAQSTYAMIPLGELPLSSRLENSAVAYAAYIYKMFWPVKLAVFYPHPLQWPAWLVAGSVVLIAGISWLVLATFRRHPYMLMGWLWYLGTLVPVIGLVQVGSQSYADRYTYVPLIGLFIMAAWGVPDFFESRKLSADLPPALAAFAIGLCVFATGFQLSYWKDNASLFTRNLEITKDNYIAEVNLGATFAEQNQFDKAIAHYKEALKIKAADANPMADLDYGQALMKKGNLAAAVSYFEVALKIDPGFLKARLNLADALIQQGKEDKAMKHLEIAALLAPDHPNVQYLYATALMRAGRMDEAEYHYRLCLKSDDSFVAARDNLALLLINEGRFQDALDELSVAVRINPRHFNTQYDFAAMLARAGRMQEAIAHYRDALRVRPDSVEAAYNLAAILATSRDASLRNGPEAVALVEHAMNITMRRDPLALNTAAAAYAEVGRFDKATALAAQALSLAQEEGRDDLVNSIKARIDLYKQNKPFHGG